MAANIPSIIGGAVRNVLPSALATPVGNIVGTIAARGASFVLPGVNWTPALFMPYRRSIGGIIAQVTIDEQHTDEVQITDHPVEAGAPISDHAFSRPQQIAITAGWSKATAYDLSAESGVYGLLLALQASFQPFDLYTGKRHYKNMLIERLAVTTDQHNEFALVAQIVCRQVIIVNTTTTTVQGASGKPAEQTAPEKTSAPASKGEQPTQQPKTAESSGAQSQTEKNDAGSGSASGEKGVTPSAGVGSTSATSGPPVTTGGSEFIEPPPAPQATPATISSP
jgi:hypothetical protein